MHPSHRLLRPLVAAFLALAALPAAGQGRQAEAWKLLDQRPANGEQCLVCRQPVHEGDIATLRYKGRTFHVAAGMVDEFTASPDAYFHRLEAHAALFDEGAVMERAVSHGWLYFGLYVLAGLLCGALCAYLAVSRGLPALSWFFAGLVANVVGVVAVLVQRARAAPELAAGVPDGFAKVPTTRSPVPCPSCGHASHPAADRCPRCGAELTPVVEAESHRV